MADLRVKGEYVGPGEQKTAEFLAERLPEDWVIFAGRKLPGPNRDDVDLIVVGNSLVFVLEEKAWGPKVVVDDNNWYVGDDARPNPLNRVAQIARIVASTLRSHANRFKNLSGGHRVLAAVVMSHDGIQILRGMNHDDSERIWGLADVPAELEALDGAFRGGALGVARKPVITYLDDLPKHAGKPKLGGYTIRSRLPGAGQEQAWEATDSAGSPVVLKCYPARSMSTQGDPETFLRREFDAISRVSGLGRTWQAYPPFFDESGQMYVVPVVPPRGGTTLQKSVQERRVPERPRGKLDDEIARGVTVDAFQALSDIHDAGLVHRTLHPKRIWLHQKLRVMFSDLNLARIEDAQSIALWASDGDMSENYRAPECQTSITLATAKSDIYSLSLCLIYWLLGEDTDNPATEAVEAKLLDTFPWAKPLLDGLANKPSERPAARALAELLLPPPSTAEEEPVPTAVGVFEDGGLIENRYQIDRKLGRGGFATSWKVYDNVRQMPMVLKEFHSDVPDDVRVEFQIAMQLHNDYCGSVYDLQVAEAPSYLVSEYVEGESLAQAQQPFTVEQLRDIAVCVLKALDYIHGRFLVHGDVTPSNIIAAPVGSSAKLIDFGLMVRRGDLPAGVTPKFAAPEVREGKPTTAASDLFGFAASMAFAMLGRPVMSTASGEFRVQPPTKEDEEAWGEEGTQLLRAFMRAAEVRPEDRPASAAELLELVRSTRTRVEVPSLQEDLKFQINPNVTSIRRLYRASGAGNAGNRGLDDDFAVATYVPTLLDQNLLPRVLAGDLDVVLLSGNPGDGKTSLLVQLGEQLKGRGAEVLHADDAGWHMKKAGRSFHAVFDASESHGELSSDALVKQALEPVRTQSDGPATALIAVNDGRLHQFFEDHGDLYEEWWFEVQDQIAGKDPGSSRIALVDLKRRSLAATDRSGLASRALAALTRSDLWTICESCAAHAGCPILANRNTLAGSGADAFAELMLISHLRRRRRSTFRDVRSAAAWLITGDRDCQDTHELIRQGRSAALMSDALSHDLAFTTTSNDYLVDEWSDLDPASVPDPRVDRARRQSRQTGGVFLPNIGSAARSLYFGELPSEEIPREAVRAYRYLPEFLAMLFGEDQVRTRDRLLLGISRLVGAPGFLNPGLAFGVGARDSGWAVLHTIGADEFSTQVADAHHVYVETIADVLVLEHSGARLALTLDTAEIILRAADGELVNDPASDAIRQEVDAFVGQLSRHPSRSAEVVDSSGSVTRATIRGVDIALAVDGSGVA
jgi:serine/threonine protein kinase